MPSSTALLRDRARRLRRDQTDAERKLWRHLRSRQVGKAKFRRQHFIHPFIVDCCCPEHWLIVELDGGQHAVQAEADQRRTAFLAAQGYRVVRFWNPEVLTDIEAVMERIVTVLSDPHPGPLPKRAREKSRA
ncbi:MAG: endonuclease domain-containing protein [Candidatus Binatia bacterium]